MKVKLIRPRGKKKAGDEIEVSARWGQHALSAGLAALPDKKKVKATESQTAEEPATEKEE